MSTYSEGTQMFWLASGLPAYQKESNDDCSWWTSLKPEELQKPVFAKDKNGKLVRVRYGFKDTDLGVFNFYNDIMRFEQPNTNQP